MGPDHAIGVPRPARHDELDRLVALISSEQAVAERAVPTVGTDPDGIRSELDALDPRWTDTARVVEDAEGRADGVAAIEWDVALGRAWVLGPWVSGGDDRWAACARPLLESVVAQLPAGLTDVELSGDRANRRIAGLAAELEWPAGPLNHALVVDEATVEGWAATELEPASGIRPAEPSDVDAIAAMHDAEFPSTYLSAPQLLKESRDDRLVLVAADTAGSDPKRLAGYVTGHVLPDGEAYLDFVAVDPDERRNGVGRRLVVTATRALLDRAPSGRLCLTVQDHRVAARHLYESLGFRHDATLVGYRRR
jgi:ribosomal protein S18 acetylase RimI-like enzyme